MKKNSRIFVSGHNGLAGSALARLLKVSGYNNLTLKSKNELDLTNQAVVAKFFELERPEYVFHTAAKVGGMSANIKYPADFLYENLMIQTNVVHYAYRNSVKKLIYFGSNCAYPRMSPQPIKEEYLLTGPLEPTNEAYAVAKIAGAKLCQYYNQQFGTDFIVVVPASIYGTNDHFDKERSHIIPLLIKNFHKAKTDNLKNILIKTNPKKLREFLYVDDLANACIYLMNLPQTKMNKKLQFVNIGTGKSITICDLAELVKKVVGFNGKIIWDYKQPEGMPEKILDVTRIQSFGWNHLTELEEGIKKTYEWFLNKEG